MKNYTIKLTMLFALIISMLSSCVVVVNEPGMPGLDGQAFFGVSYTQFSPYSYWDNNPSIPADPILGRYYPTAPGIYDFEYFVNEDEYWFGTYEIWINPGGMGGPRGEPGLNGSDNYLMLICDHFGYAESRSQSYKNATAVETEDEVTITEDIDGKKYTIKMKKTTVGQRAPKGTH